MTGFRRAAAAIFLLTMPCARAHAGWQWWWVERGIDAKSPKVRSISTDELAKWLRDPGRAKPLLLDVRTSEEFRVSHLAGAQRVEPGAEPGAVRLLGDKQAPIVTYCSVGLRSAAFAGKLRKAGYGDVRNLHGSIFQWANEGRPLVDMRGSPTAKVHPYNAFWGRLLAPAHR